MTHEDQAFQSILFLIQRGELEGAKQQWNTLPARLQATAKMLQLMGIISIQQKQFDEAAKYFKQAIKQAPVQAPLYVNLGNAYLEMGKLEQAIDCYDRGIRLNPDLAELFYNRGLALKKAEKSAEALKSFKKAVKKKPVYAEAWNELALAYSEQGNLELAEEAANQALCEESGRLRAWLMKANVALARARPDEAEALFKRVLELDRNQPEALLWLAMLELTEQSFEEGWVHYQARWMSSTRHDIGGIARTANPKYQPGQGYRRVLVWSEQGVGDDVFFVNMLAALGAWGPELLVTVDPRLLDIMKRSVPGVTFLSKREVLPDDQFDAHLPMGDLGLYLSSPDVIARRTQTSRFLESRPENRGSPSFALDFLKPGEKLCGISWRSKAEKMGAGKSLKLAQLLPVLSVPGYAFINLQYGDVSEEIAEFRDRYGITVHQLEGLDLFDDIEGLSALIGLCDAVVSVSNVTAHLSGALGQNTCLLRSNSYINSIWYWRNVREGQNVWYPSVKVLVQAQSGEWGEALGQVCEQLEVWR
jgi:tetratricopeptide (TPR) repeat protein